MRRQSIRKVVLSGMVVVGLVMGLGVAVSEAATPPYNIIVFLTDDQRFDLVTRVIDGQVVMQNIKSKLIDHSNGVTFTNAFVSAPLCCPDRASLLAGGYYAHETGVLTNDWPNGSAQKFGTFAGGVDRKALPPKLQRAGYKTALIGKYLNGFKKLGTYVPPGWTKFVGTLDHGNWLTFTMLEGSSDPDNPGTGTVVSCTQQTCPYMTYFLQERALKFINDYAPTSPIFLVFSPHAPHNPATPAPGDEKLFPNFVYRERGWCEGDLSDKPLVVRQQAHSCDPTEVENKDEFHRNQVRSLQAVDRAIGAIVDKIAALGKLAQTVFVFTSDNGYLWLEHRLTAKGKPYEEAIRVPLIVVQPGVARRTDGHLVVSNLDMGATIPVWAGLASDVDILSDGLNLVKLLEDEKTSWRTEFLIEDFGESKGGVWAGLRTLDARYNEWGATEEAEFYDLGADPYELSNDSTRPGIPPLRERLSTLKGLAIITHPKNIPDGQVGQFYNFVLKAWGGSPPYSWRVHEQSPQSLPPGLELQTLGDGSARIMGTPNQAGTFTVWIAVKDNAPAKFTGLPQEYILEKMLNIVTQPSRGGR